MVRSVRLILFLSTVFDLLCIVLQVPVFPSIIL